MHQKKKKKKQPRKTAKFKPILHLCYNWVRKCYVKRNSLIHYRLIFFEHITLMRDALHDLAHLYNLKNVKNTHGGN